MLRKIPIKTISIIFLFVLGLLVYSNTLFAPFHFDDISFICENHSIREILRVSRIWDYWSTRFTGFFSFALNYYFHGLNVFGYRVVNVFLHVSSAALVFWLARLTFLTPALREERIRKNKDYVIFFSTLLFLLHPVQTEALNYVFQRVTLLAAFFYLSSICFYAKAALLSEVEVSLGKTYYFFSLICALAAMLSKEMAFTLPFAVLLYDFCFLRQKHHLRWKRIVPFFVMLPVIPVLILKNKPLVFVNIQKLVENPVVNSGQYLLTQLRVLVTYLRLFMFPIRQNLDYDYPLTRSPLELPVLASFFLLLLILILALRMFSKFRLVSFGIFWFFLTLAPESSIIPLTDVIYEHRLYLPLAGCSIAAIAGIYYLFGEKMAILVKAVLISAVICLSVLSYNRNKAWKSEFSLWNDTVTKSPLKARPYNERGLAYMDKGEFDKAILDFTRAVSLDPHYAGGYYNRGQAYRIKEKYDLAAADFKQVLSITPDSMEAYIYLAASLNGAGKNDEARAAHKKAKEVRLRYAEYYCELGKKFKGAQKYKHAAASYIKALEFAPDDLSLLDELAGTCILSAHFKKAQELYKKIIEINPGLSAAHNNLALAYYYDRQFDLAIKHIDLAQKLGYKVSPEFLNLIKPHRKRD